MADLLCEHHNGSPE